MCIFHKWGFVPSKNTWQCLENDCCTEVKHEEFLEVLKLYFGDGIDLVHMSFGNLIEHLNAVVGKVDWSSYGLRS